MERVAFLVEETGDHIAAMLNPETLVVSRTSGARPRRSGAGLLSGPGVTDDPILLTGGGRTEVRIDLLFDVDLVEPANSRPDDVRDLTRAIWQMGENSADADGRQQPPNVRFVWGRAWNIPGIVTEVAERFDRFSPAGVPLRSWLRMSFLRTRLASDEHPGETYEDVAAPSGLDPHGTPTRVVVPLGEEGGDPRDPTPLSPVQLGLLSLDAFGTPFFWKVLLDYNGVDDPLAVSGPLAVPPPNGNPT
jgi:hypothetical protein